MFVDTHAYIHHKEIRGENSICDLHLRKVILFT